MALKKFEVSYKPRPFIAYELTVENLPTLAKILEFKHYDVRHMDGEPVQVSIQTKDRSTPSVVYFTDKNVHLIGINEDGDLRIMVPENDSDFRDFKEL